MTNEMYLRILDLLHERVLEFNFLGKFENCEQNANCVVIMAKLKCRPTFVLIRYLSPSPFDFSQLVLVFFYSFSFLIGMNIYLSNLKSVFSVNVCL